MEQPVPVRGLFIKALPPIGSTRVTNSMNISIPWYSVEVMPNRQVKLTNTKQD